MILGFPYASLVVWRAESSALLADVVAAVPAPKLPSSLSASSDGEPAFAE